MSVNEDMLECTMLNFQNKSEVFSAENSGELARKRGSIYRKLLTMFLFCALCFTLAMPALVQAEDLEISEPLASQSVRAAGEPKVDTVSVGNKAISGDIKMGQGQRKHKNLTFTITVTVNRKAGGTEEKTVSIPPTERKTTWSVTLGSALAEGDKVTVTEVGETSKTVTIEVQPSLKNQHNDDLKMPVGEIWIEQTSANIVNEEEHAEAFELLKAANPTIAKDFKSIEFSIVGNQSAFYTVTYTDDSVTDKIEAPELKIKQVTETSIGATIGDITVVDNVIKGKLQGDGPFNNIKVQISTKLSAVGITNFSSAKCTIDKDSSNPVEATVDSTTGEFSYTIPAGKELDRTQVVGVAVKEKNKFKSCGTSTVELAMPKKTEVRDPKKLTDEEKAKISEAIRKANTTKSGVSKLPDGTGYVNDPAFIEFDKDGNVSIISPNDVEVTWDSNYNPVYQKNADGTYKIQSGKENSVIKISAKDLVKNIAPKSPAIAVNVDEGKVTITPPAYENPGDDTDLASYTITYKDAANAEKSITVTRTVDKASGKTTWSADNATVDASTGAVNLEIKDFALGATVKAIATDNGGLIAEETPLNSEEQGQTLETAKVAYDRNGGKGDMPGKTLNKGVKYAILANIFTAPNENQEFKTWQIGDKEYAANDEFIVKADTVVKAIWKNIQVKVSYDGNGGKGSMDSATVDKGSTYKLLDSGFTAP
ncbi:MAG: hypothetical protein KH423_06840, partial [Actinomycetaceae bacterium]|nr:hypothetical protein [Actinomycetaceae bacterium]